MDTITIQTRLSPPIVLTAAEHARLSAVASAVRDSSAGLLEQELDRATIVPVEELADDVVTMGATVEYVDLGTGRPRIVTLVYPWRADIERGLISVTAPVGA